MGKDTTNFQQPNILLVKGNIRIAVNNNFFWDFPQNLQ